MHELITSFFIELRTSQHHTYRRQRIAVHPQRRFDFDDLVSETVPGLKSYLQMQNLREHVLLLQADWTRRDPAISRALTALGRSGVPVYVLHVPGKPPQVLSELLSPDLVIKAIQSLGSDSN